MRLVQEYVRKLRELLGNRFVRVLLFVLIGVYCCFIMFSNVKPEKINIQLFQPSEQTIRATKTVEDTYKTEQEKAEATKQVSDVYTLKKEYAQNKVDLISSIFDSALEVKKEAEETIRKDETGKNIPVSTKDQLSLLKEKLTEDVSREIGDTVLTSLVNADEDELNITKDLTITAVNNVMSTKIAANDVENAKKKAEEELRYASISSELKSASFSLARNAIIQNYFFDREKTEDQRRKAIETVEPVKILQGQIIVEEGQLVEREVYRQLELAGFLNNENTIYPFAGLFLLVFISLAGFYYYFYHSNDLEISKTNQMLIFALVFILSIGTMKIFSLLGELKYGEIGYFFPAALAAMLLKILLNERFAAAIMIILGAFGSIIFNTETPGNLNYTIGLYILFSGIAAIVVMSRKNFQVKILQAGLVLSVINILLVFAITSITNGNYTKMEFMIYSLAAIVSALGSAVLTIGLLPFFEAGFGILSSIKLLELANPNHPLIRKILTEAPGTYHHSVMVANLAESACEAIGANGLLARVGCYYHDIGKTKRPHFFIENQMNSENPHDRLPPETSKDIIIAHAVDGAVMLRKHKFPQEIVDIAEQHHGTTLLKFFYHKVLKEDETTLEGSYRYPGPKAQSKEVAIIGIADSVEAAVRSMNHPTQEKIEALVRAIITDRLNDNQFDECNITMRELHVVREALCESLHGIFHSRIEYPEMNKTEQKVNL
ncbi:HD family phosphohydrolase [Peribacillus loiseleuriae]|uniref:Membrane protein n=1 Tax=Peribacillus loiseleuriae TaxID=1679170 RepID=A0A0K9GX54_9BACI|nr:HD family phosphohydrolase [Peribacillus loiseleuriae]KMY50842.1 membrane protein [Peribacillus loiseleuriae]